MRLSLTISWSAGCKPPFKIHRSFQIPRVDHSCKCRPDGKGERQLLDNIVRRMQWQWEGRTLATLKFLFVSFILSPLPIYIYMPIIEISKSSEIKNNTFNTTYLQLKDNK